MTDLATTRARAADRTVAYRQRVDAATAAVNAVEALMAAGRGRS